MFVHAPAPSRRTRRRLSRARAVRREAGGRCQVKTGPRRRPCRAASSGVVAVDGRQVAACYRHLPNRQGYAHGIPPWRDPDGWARDLLAKLRRDLATSDDNAA